MKAISARDADFIIGNYQSAKKTNIKKIEFKSTENLIINQRHSYQNWLVQIRQ